MSSTILANSNGFMLGPERFVIEISGRLWGVPGVQHLFIGTLRKSSGFGVFAEIFSQNIVIPSREIPSLGEAPQRF
jgi:hypothetical protein